MAVGTLTLSINTRLLQLQLQQLGALLEQLPKRRARRFVRKTYRLLHGSNICQLRSRKSFFAPVAGDLAVQIRVGGMDELIAAAMRARKSEFCHG